MVNVDLASSTHTIYKVTNPRFVQHTQNKQPEESIFLYCFVSFLITSLKLYFSFPLKMLPGLFSILKFISQSVTVR